MPRRFASSCTSLAVFGSRGDHRGSAKFRKMLPQIASLHSAFGCSLEEFLAVLLAVFIPPVRLFLFCVEVGNDSLNHKFLHHPLNVIPPELSGRVECGNDSDLFVTIRGHEYQYPSLTSGPDRFYPPFTIDKIRVEKQSLSQADILGFFNRYPVLRDVVSVCVVPIETIHGLSLPSSNAAFCEAMRPVDGDCCLFSRPAVFSR